MMSSSTTAAAARECIGVRLVAARDRLALGRVGLTVLLAAAVAMTASMVVLVAVARDVIQHDGLEVSDGTNLAVVTGHRSALLVDAARAVTNLGSVALLLPLAAVAGLLLWSAGQRLVIALAPALALGLAGVAAGVGKVVVARPRPPAGGRLVTEADASFPSGHATDSTAFYVTIGLLLALLVFHRPLARLVSVATTALLAAAIGASRLVLGVHWPTDVLGGAALGAAVALAATTVAVLIARQTPAEQLPLGTRWGRTRWTILRFLNRRRGPSSVQAAQGQERDGRPKQGYQHELIPALLLDLLPPREVHGIDGGQ